MPIEVLKKLVLVAFTSMAVSLEVMHDIIRETVFWDNLKKFRIL